MKQYELLIFDFDGTLVDTAPDIAYYANQVLVEFGFQPKSIEAVKKAVGWGVHELLRVLAPEFEKSPDRLEEAVKHFKTYYRENPVRFSSPFECVMDMLKGPLSSSRKAIVTNKPQDITEKILKSLDMAQFFEKVIGMHAGFEPKPDPTSLLHMLNFAGISAENTVYIGDSKIDAQTSLNAGVDFAWVSYGYDDMNGFDGPKPKYSFHQASQWQALAGRVEKKGI